MFYNFFVKRVSYFFIFIFGLFTIANSNSNIYENVYEDLLNEKNNQFIITYIKKAIDPVFIDPKQVFCLVKNVLYEAEGEPIEGQAAVIYVVINRVIDERFPNTPCKVIYQHNYTQKDNDLVKTCQFSWVCEDNLRKINKKSEYFKNAEKLVYDIILRNHYNNIVTSKTLFFHAVYVNPKWKYKKVTRIGNHIFYEKH